MVNIWCKLCFLFHHLGDNPPKRVTKILAKYYNIGSLECNQEWPTHPIRVYPKATQGIAIKGLDEKIPIRITVRLKAKIRNSLTKLGGIKCSILPFTSS